MTNHSKSGALRASGKGGIGSLDDHAEWNNEDTDRIAPLDGQVDPAERQAVGRLMRSLGNRVLAALGEEPLNPDQDLLPNLNRNCAGFDIEEAFAEVDRIMALPGVLDARARTLCEEVRSELRCEFAAFQIVHPHKHMIETIAAAGPALEWVGAARHPMIVDEGQPQRRDIQADVVLRNRGTVIRGWDDRLDRYLFHTFHHEKALRAFFPVVNPINLSDRSVVSGDLVQWKVEAALDRLEIIPIAPLGTELEVIGTIETGFLYGDMYEIDEGFLLDLARVSSRHTANIYDATIKSALEKLATVVMHLCGGESASLHLLRESLNVPPSPHVLYSYNVVVGQATSLARANSHGGGGISDPPRRDGLGAAALSKEKPSMIPDPRMHEPTDALKGFNAKIWGDHHVRAMVAFPLLVAIPDGRSELGLIYVHHHTAHPLNPTHIDHIYKVVGRASACLRSILDRNEEKERVRQGSALLNLLRYSVLAASRGATLDDLARNIAYLLGADVVGIVPHTRDATWSAPTIVGRVDLDTTCTFLVGIAASIANTDTSGRVRFVRDARQVNKKGDCAEGDELNAATAPSFASQEGIVSAAYLVLRDHATRTLRGVMYLGFRSYRSFPDSEANIVRVIGDLVIAVMDGRPPDTEPMSAALLLANPGRDSGYGHSGH